MAQCDGGGDVCVSRQGPGKCEYDCGTLPTELGRKKGGGEEKRKTEGNEVKKEEEEEMKMKGGIGSSTPTLAFSLGDEP